MFTLSESAEDQNRSALSWIAFLMFTAGAGLVFVDFKPAAALFVIAGNLLGVLDRQLKRKPQPINVLPPGVVR
jgi:hypothetical protein